MIELIQFVAEELGYPINQEEAQSILEDFNKESSCYIVEERVSGTDHWESVSIELSTLRGARRFLENHVRNDADKSRFRIVEVHGT